MVALIYLWFHCPSWAHLDHLAIECRLVRLQWFCLLIERKQLQVTYDLLTSSIIRDTQWVTDSCGFDELHACYRRILVVPFALSPLEIFTRPWKSWGAYVDHWATAAGVPLRAYCIAKTETGVSCSGLKDEPLCLCLLNAVCVKTFNWMYRISPS